MIEVEQRDPWRPAPPVKPPSEAELREELAGLNRQLAELNDEAGRIESERRSVQHRLRETSKVLQRHQAARVKGELSSLGGSGPREEWGRKPRLW